MRMVGMHYFIICQSSITGGNKALVKSAILILL